MRTLALILAITSGGCVTAAWAQRLAPVGSEVLNVIYMGKRPEADQLMVCGRTGAAEVRCVEYEYFHSQLDGGR